MTYITQPTSHKLASTFLWLSLTRWVSDVLYVHIQPWQITVSEVKMAGWILVWANREKSQWFLLWFQLRIIGIAALHESAFYFLIKCMNVWSWCFQCWIFLTPVDAKHTSRYQAQWGLFMLDCVERWLCYVVHLHFLKYFSCKIIYACCKVSPSKMISLQANPDFWQIRSHLACSDLCLVLVNTHFHLDTQPVPRLSRKTHSSVVIQNIKFCGVLFASCFQDFQFCSVNLDSS